MTGTEIVIGLLSDCITYTHPSALTAAVGALSNTAVSKLINKRHTILREVILSEMRQGSFENVDKDELTSIFFRLIRDAEEGVAKNNLKLMARVIDGMAVKQEVKAPTFLKYANILANLTEEEIVVLGIMSGLDWKISFGDRKEKFTAAGIPQYESIQQALLRTGLIKMSTQSSVRRRTSLDHSNVLGSGEERELDIKATHVYGLTPLMSEILSYTDFLIKKEDV